MASINDDGWRPYIVFIKGRSDNEPLLTRGLAYHISVPTDTDIARTLVARLSSRRSSVLDPLMGRGAVAQATIAVGIGSHCIANQETRASKMKTGIYISITD
jgi:hypothetical protein